MHNTWELMLGEEYTDDVREAWDVVFDYIIQKLTFGYKCYIADKENDRVTAAKNSDNLQAMDSIQE